jgi:RNA-directed DNA polymerase
MLDVLDRELMKRGHRFVRYADDCNIYVQSRRAGERVMLSIERFLSRRLKLTVNRAKSAVDAPSCRKFLGFSFLCGKEVRRCIASQALLRFKSRVRELTRRNRSMTLRQIVEDLSRYLQGWRGYFGFCQTPSVLYDLDKWIRRRLRCLAWKQWRRGRVRFAELRRQGVSAVMAAHTAGSPQGPWRISNTPALNRALSNRFFRTFGLVSVSGGETS